VARENKNRPAPTTEELRESHDRAWPAATCSCRRPTNISRPCRRPTARTRTRGKTHRPGAGWESFSTGESKRQRRSPTAGFRAARVAAKSHRSSFKRPRPRAISRRPSKNGSRHSSKRPRLEMRFNTPPSRSMRVSRFMFWAFFYCDPLRGSNGRKRSVAARFYIYLVVLALVDRHGGHHRNAPCGSRDVRRWTNLYSFRAVHRLGRRRAPALSWKRFYKERDRQPWAASGGSGSARCSSHTILALEGDTLEMMAGGFGFQFSGFRRTCSA